MQTPDPKDLIASKANIAGDPATASSPLVPRHRKAPAGLKLSIRRHARGHFFVRDNGKDIYLSTNLNEAYKKAVSLLGADRIHDIGAERPKGVPSFVSKVQRDFKRWKQTPTSDPGGKNFRQGAVDFFETIEAEKGALTAKHYRKTLGSFLAVFGDQPLNEIPPTELRRYRIELIKKYAPKSVNHHLASLRRFFRFCFDMDFVKQPMRANLLKSVPLPPTPDKALPIERVREIIASVARVNPNLAKMMLLQFWTCMRPSEVSKVLFKSGEFEPRYPGVFKLKRGKTDLQTGEWTRIVFTEEALELLKSIKPDYTQHRYYCRAVQRVAEAIGDDFSPGPLRHSASTALIEAGVDGETVETCLHHILKRVQRTYRPQPYQKAREALKLLSTLVPLSVLKESAELLAN
jgi:integrase